MKQQTPLTRENPEVLTPQKKENNRPIGTLLGLIEDPRSLRAVLSPDNAAKIDAHIVKHPEYFEMEEEELIERMGKSYEQSSSMLETLRMNFWIEYDRSVSTRREKMNFASVYLGVCNRDNFYRILDNPLRTAFILCRPAEYNSVMSGLLALSTRRIKDILHIPLLNRNGDLQDPKILEVILKAAAMVELRNKGNYLERREQKSISYVEQKNTSISAMFNGKLNSPQSKEEIFDMAQSIDEKIKELEEQLKEVTDQTERRHEEVVTDTRLKPDESITAEYTEVEPIVEPEKGPF